MRIIITPTATFDHLSYEVNYEWEQDERSILEKLLNQHDRPIITDQIEDVLLTLARDSHSIFLVLHYAKLGFVPKPEKSVEA